MSKETGFATLQSRRLHGVLTETYKILTNKEHLDGSNFFQSANPGYNL